MSEEQIKSLGGIQVVEKIKNGTKYTIKHGDYLLLVSHVPGGFSDTVCDTVVSIFVNNEPMFSDVAMFDSVIMLLRDVVKEINREQKDAVSDTTDDDSSTKAD